MSRLSLGLLMFLGAGPAFAGPADYVYTPAVSQGERELGIKYGAASPVAGVQVAAVGMGYGISEFWFAEVYLKRERNGNQDVTLAEFENKFQLTETGKYAVDVGLLAELEAPLSGLAPWELRVGPLLEKGYGKLQLNANLFLERAFGRADENGVPFCTNLAYQYQLKYRWKSALEFGMQGLGELGKWDSWSGRADQNHRIGPALFGKLALGPRQAIKYNAALLFGASAAAPVHTLRTQIEYEF